VSTYGDVYSYGILLLEMFTGKRPIDNMFKDSLNLHDFVKANLPERVIDIVDPILLWEREDGETRMNGAQNQIKSQIQDGETRMNGAQNQNQIGRPKIQECLTLILGIGVSCSMEFPRERMNISNVVAMLFSIREKLLRSRIPRERQRLQFTGKSFMIQYLLQHPLQTFKRGHRRRGGGRSYSQHNPMFFYSSKIENIDAT
jgi:serine/threonine protein kinase